METNTTILPPPSPSPSPSPTTTAVGGTQHGSNNNNNVVLFLGIACAIDRISHEVKQRKATTSFAIGVAVVVDSAIKH